MMPWAEPMDHLIRQTGTCPSSVSLSSTIKTLPDQLPAHTQDRGMVEMVEQDLDKGFSDSVCLLFE